MLSVPSSRRRKKPSTTSVKRDTFLVYPACETSGPQLAPAPPGRWFPHVVMPLTTP
ncbi:hypothetical protein LX36DRAFT_70581 [Colletotrichum falcatum]|nr:hypothetical protein LX36DRAFT_70581 [Colletotrichum falcatum]